jgi:hypothetical protein
VALINDNYICMGEGQLLRCDTSGAERVDAGDLTIRCAIWKFARHKNAMIDSEVQQLVSTLIHKLSAMGKKHDTVPLVRSTFYDLSCDDCLAAPGWCSQHDPAITGSDRLANVLNRGILVRTQLK